MFSLVVGLLAFASADEVRIADGKISGATGRSPAVRVYKGIPFAAPPVGDLRWSPPQPVAKWTGVRKTDEFSAVCMQTPYPAGSLYYSELKSISEDCLYLNVWTTSNSPSDRRPVMVWIHGGALTRGSGSTPVYDGEEFAKKGVVLVTINYRLGVFGFFAHPELTAESKHKASGNQGLLDQVAALRWVKNNIEAFGGDPGNVTIFGESAGSWSVNVMMATPLTKGLIHRAIGESGGVFQTMRTLAESERAGSSMGTVKDLRAKSADDLMKSSAQTQGIVDGLVLPADIHSIFSAGKQNDVPVLLGFNADEGTAFLPTLTAENAKQTYDTFSKLRSGDDAEAFAKAYPAANGEEMRKAALAAWGDATFGWQMRTWARLQSKTGKSPAYLYFFTRVPPGRTASERFGSYHAAEIAYVFGNLNAPRTWEDTDRKLSAAMMNYWVNFAKAGDPNGAGLAEWPKYSASADPWLGLGDAIAVRKNLHQPGLDLIDRYFQAQRTR